MNIKIKIFCYSAGGLVTAVAPVVINGGGLWVGWPGIHFENPNEPIPESDPSDITPTAGLKSDKVCMYVYNIVTYTILLVIGFLLLIAC